VLQFTSHFYSGEIMDYIPVIEVSGSNYDCGVAIGKAMRDNIHENLRDYPAIIEHETGTGRDAAMDYVTRIIPVIEAYAPEVMEEMSGIAKGADVHLNDIVMLNARTELMSAPAITDTDIGECTSMTALGAATESGNVLMGQNWDWNSRVCHRTAVIVIVVPDQPRTVMFAEAGLVGKIGLNAAGVAVCANRLTSTDDKLQTGIPWHVQLRKVMMAENMHQAIKAVTAPARGASGMFMIAAREGEAITLETTPEDFGTQLPEDGIMTHSNHYLAPEMKSRDTGKSRATMTLIRHDRARRLLAEDKGKITIDSFKRVLTDHFSYPAAICRHPDETMPERDRSQTGASIIMDLDQSEMHFALGPPCQHEYKTVRVLR
jgi:isopenicillin-N N-acyltransferase like protein